MRRGGYTPDTGRTPPPPAPGKDVRQDQLVEHLPEIMGALQDAVSIYDEMDEMQWGEWSEWTHSSYEIAADHARTVLALLEKHKTPHGAESQRELSAGNTPTGNEATMTEITTFVQVCTGCERVFVVEGHMKTLPCGCGYGVAATAAEVARAIDDRRQGRVPRVGQGVVDA